MISRNFVYVVSVAAALVAGGCATNPTSINAQWASPSLAGSARMQNVLVIAVLRDSTHRRMLEDRMVESLGAAGVKATPSHRVLGEAAQVSEEQLQQVVTSAGASHVLISSMSGVTTDVRVTPGMVTGPGWGPGWGRTSPMGPSWRGMSTYYNSAWARSTPTEVRTTQNTHGDTRLFDVASSEVVWSVATTTTDRGDVSTRIDGFVRLIVDTLKKDSLI